MKRGCRRQGFTIVEMLVVIAIIAILASILLPMMTRALDKADEARARTEVKSIETAVKAYLNEYSRFPHGSGNVNDYTYGPGGSQANNRFLMNVLRSIAGDGNTNQTNNPRKIVFLEIGDSSLDNGNFVDPWGVQYMITVDTGFDNDCRTPGASGFGTIVGRQVVVWSLGKEGQSGTAYTNNYIRSWE